MAAKLYHFSRDTGEYLPLRYPEGHPHNFADPSPMEPGVWLVPAFATLIEPPVAPAGMVAVFDADAGDWSLKPTEVVNPPPPPPTTEMLIAALREAAAEHLDVVARAQGFLGIEDAVSYAEEPAVVRYQQFGRALRAWRSLTRAAVDSLIGELEAGHAEMPASKAAFIAALPRFVPPTAEEIEAATAAKLEAQHGNG